MRYRVQLVPNQKNNYVKLPADSAIRQALNVSSASRGISTTYFSSANQNSHCSALKLQPVGDNDDYETGPKTFYFGFVGGVSAESNTVEIGQEVGAMMQLEDGMLV